MKDTTLAVNADEEKFILLPEFFAKLLIELDVGIVLGKEILNVVSNLELGGKITCSYKEQNKDDHDKLVKAEYPHAGQK